MNSRNKLARSDGEKFDEGRTTRKRKQTRERGEDGSAHEGPEEQSR